jgi:hypothetical protein
VRVARATEDDSLDRWIAVNGPVMEAQFARREPGSGRPADMPPATSALEQITTPILAALHPHRYALKFRERLDRLLMLLQLHANGQDGLQACAKAIRLQLEPNGQAAHCKHYGRSPILLAHLSTLT